MTLGAKSNADLGGNRDVGARLAVTGSALRRAPGEVIRIPASPRPLDRASGSRRRLTLRRNCAAVGDGGAGRGPDPHCGAKNRHARLGARHHPGAWARQAGRPRHSGGRACFDRGRQDRAAQRLGRHDRIGLAVGRARTLARRQSRLLSLYQHARRGDDAGEFPDRRACRSQGQEARGCRRPARQELADASGGRAPRRPRPQLRRRRSSMARRRCCPQKAVQRETRRHPHLLEFLRRTRRPRIQARHRHGGRSKSASARRDRSPWSAMRSTPAGRQKTARQSRVSSMSPPRPRTSSPARRPNGQRLAPRIGVTDKAGLDIYRRRYGEGIPRRPIAQEANDARALYHVLAALGGADLVGPAPDLDKGTFYDPGKTD